MLKIFERNTMLFHQKFCFYNFANFLNTIYFFEASESSMVISISNRYLNKYQLFSIKDNIGPY